MSVLSTTRDPRRRSRRPPLPWFRIAALGLAAWILVAVILDVRRFGRRTNGASDHAATDLQAIVLGMNGPRYADPRGLFSIVPPAGWAIRTYPDTGPYDVVFRGPCGADISIIATPVPYNSLAELIRRIDAAERKAGLAMHRDAVFLNGRAAVQRTGGLHDVRLFTIDFVESNVAHHLQCAIPPELYERYYAVLMDVLKTYEPL